MFFFSCAINVEGSYSKSYAEQKCCFGLKLWHLEYKIHLVAVFNWCGFHVTIPVYLKLQDLKITWIKNKYQLNALYFKGLVNIHSIKEMLHGYIKYAH